MASADEAEVGSKGAPPPGLGRGPAADEGGGVERAVSLLGVHAPSLLHLVQADPGLLPDVLARPLEHGSSRATQARELAGFVHAREDDDAFRRGLRRFHHRAIVRIALREIERAADIAQTSREMATLAAVIIEAALEHARSATVARFGEASLCGRPLPLTVLGMGKLGGGELNLGSDVDLIFFYESDDATVETGDLTAHEWAARIVRRAVAAMSEVTADGFCFRVDLRLRPEGRRGPIANSIASAERYYESWGRTWERAALARATPVAGDEALGAQVLEMLRPFIYRRAVDPGLADDMAEMLERSRRELNVDASRDVKLGPGGIREAEFFVQTLQLVWGGRYPELRVPGTLAALERLEALGLVSAREHATLASSWGLLRRIEHRIHVWTGYQTHELPADPEALDRFAASLGFADGAELAGTLDAARRDVSRLFAGLRPDAPGPDARVWDRLGDLVARGEDPQVIADCLVERIDVENPIETAGHLARLARRAGAPLGTVTWERTPELGRLLLTEVAEAADPEAALRWLAEFFARIGGGAPYYRTLVEEPRRTRRLVGLFGASGTLSSALVGHPEDMDLLLGERAPRAAEIAQAHGALDPDEDPELLVAELRRLKRVFTLRVGLAAVAREVSLGAAMRRLSDLADAQIRVCLEAASRWGERRFGAARSSLVVAALGKLGGRELGFGADLDLVFLYGADGETEKGTTHAELFARVAQRTLQFLRQRDAHGAGYETDTRLRPSGSKGTLVVSLSAFDRYHEGRAAPWERQALVRARVVAGAEEVGAQARARFEHLAYELGSPEPEELARLRARIQRELAGENVDRYHPKLGFGGLLDVELLLQSLQMRHGSDPAVRTTNTREAISRLASVGALDRTAAEALTQGYDFLRAVEQALKLMSEHREPMLEPRGRSAAHVARSLGVRARDALEPLDVLARTYRARVEAVRQLFDSTVAPVAAPAPWGTPS